MAETIAKTYISDLPSTESPLAAGDKIIIEKASGGTKIMAYSEFIEAVAASMVTNAGTVTDDLHVASGKQLNPNVSGTLAASIASLNSSLKHIEVKLVTVTCQNSNQSSVEQVTWDNPFSTANGYVVVVSQNVGDTIFNGAVAEVTSKSSNWCMIRLVRPSSIMNGSAKIAVIAVE